MAPRIIRSLFDKFPLQNYPPESLPATNLSSSSIPVLYVADDFVSCQLPTQQFTSSDPSCLKWQIYLKICGIDFLTAPSNHHASPTGALPYLILGKGITDHRASSSIISSTKLVYWIDENGGDNSIQKLQKLPLFLAFEALINTRIKNAWNYCIYLSTDPILPFPGSKSVFPVRFAIEQQTKQVILKEIRKMHSSGLVVAEEILAEADFAFDAISKLLGDGDWFFSEAAPTYYDACVYGYTHLIYSFEYTWEEFDLVKLLKKYENLRKHHDRIRLAYHT